MKDHVNEATGQPFMRGAMPTPRHLLAAALPYRPLKDIPPYFFILPRTLNMWGNATYGCCVSSEEAFNKACNGIFISENEVIRWARSNGVLNGANLEPVIQQMQSQGFSQDNNVYGDGTGMAVNYADAPTMKSAIFQAGQMGGCIKFALAADALPSGAGNNNGWFMPTSSVDTNYDHCMGASGYGTAQQFCSAMNEAFGLSLTVPSGVDPTMQGYANYTWSTIGFVGEQAFVNYAGEAWIRNPSSITHGTGTPTPDSVYVTGAPTPVVCPPGQHPDPVTGLCVPDVVPPTPPVGSVTIPAGVTLGHVLGFLPVTSTANTFPVNYSTHGSIGLVLPPWLVTALRDLCMLAPALPAPWNTLAGYLCGFVPPAAMSGAQQGITIPPWLVPVFVGILKLVCANIAYLPVNIQQIATVICGFLPQAQAHAAKCGCNP